MAYSLLVLAAVANDRGEHERARSLQREAQALGREVGDKRLLASVLEGVACTLAAQGRCERAALCLVGAASALREMIKAARSPSEQDLLDRHLDAARRVLGPEASDGALGEGRRMTLDEALTYALECEDQPQRP